MFKIDDITNRLTYETGDGVILVGLGDLNWGVCISKNPGMMNKLGANLYQRLEQLKKEYTGNDYSLIHKTLSTVFKRAFKRTEIEKAAHLASEIKIVCRRGEEIDTYYPIRLEAPDVINHVSEKNAFYLPENADFIKLSGELELTNEPNYEKVENHCGRDSVGLYYFEGPEFRKYAEAHEIRNLGKHDAT